LGVITETVFRGAFVDAAPHSHFEDYAYNVPGPSSDGIEFGKGERVIHVGDRDCPDCPSRSLRLGKDGE